MPRWRKPLPQRPGTDHRQIPPPHAGVLLLANRRPRPQARVRPDNLAYYDDLAVAYEKTGQHDKAIETILIKDKKKPGVYETESNLGTFLMVNGRLEEGPNTSTRPSASIPTPISGGRNIRSGWRNT